jgi:hypothetical protein
MLGKTMRRRLRRSERGDYPGWRDSMGMRDPIRGTNGAAKLQSSPRGFRWLIFALLAVCFLAGGCYDATVLVEQVQSDALRNQLHEVNLGYYHTTMPRNPATRTYTEMELRLFGMVPQYRIPAIEKQLKSDGYRLRFETLAAIRDTTEEELAEPDLTQLRARLTEVANNVLEDAPFKTVGLEDFRIGHR